jgi:hypothetical protein
MMSSTGRVQKYSTLFSGANQRDSVHCSRSALALFLLARTQKSFSVYLYIGVMHGSIVVVVYLLCICSCGLSSPRVQSLKSSHISTLNGVLRNSLALGSAFLAPQLTTAAVTSGAAVAGQTSAQPSFESVEATAKFIRSYCPTILKAARESGLLLYRGENSVKGKHSLLIQSKSDLTDPKTYDSFAAADYFTSFSHYTSGIFDSGLIATSQSMDASAWGPVASIWPLDNPGPGGGFAYGWLRKDKYFWDSEWNAPQSRGLQDFGGPFFWKNENNLRVFLEGGKDGNGGSGGTNLVLNSGLSMALSAGHEIIFGNDGQAINRHFSTKAAGSNASDTNNKANLTSSSRSPSSSVYVAVPLLLESKLLAALSITPFNPSVRAVTVAPGDRDTYIDNGMSLESLEGSRRAAVRRGGEGGTGGRPQYQYRQQYPATL